jgi:hypothetical protein
MVIGCGLVSEFWSGSEEVNARNEGCPAVCLCLGYFFPGQGALRGIVEWTTSVGLTERD